MQPLNPDQTPQTPFIMDRKMITRVKFFQQHRAPEFLKVHKLLPGETIKMWDVDFDPKPPVQLGPLEDAPDDIGRVIYGLPPQIARINEMPPEEYATNYITADMMQTAIEAQKLRAMPATGEEARAMRNWSSKTKTGIQYIPAGLSPALNDAAKFGEDWKSVVEASRSIMLAGESAHEGLPGCDATYDHPMIQDVPDLKPFDFIQSAMKRPPNS